MTSCASVARTWSPTRPSGPIRTPNPTVGLYAAEVGARVTAALDMLPQRQREAIVLCHYQELSNIEAARLMGVSVEALESLLSRGRRSLRAALADIGREGV